MDTIMIEHIMRGMLDRDLIEGPHGRMTDATGDLDRVIDHGHCLSIVDLSRLSSTIPECDPFCCDSIIFI